MSAGHTVINEIDRHTCLYICGAVGEVPHHRVKGSDENITAIANKVDALLGVRDGIKALAPERAEVTDSSHS